MWLSLRCKTRQNWPTRVLFSPPWTQRPNGFLWSTCPRQWGRVSASVCCREWRESASTECAGRNSVVVGNLTPNNFHVWLTTQTIKPLTCAYFSFDICVQLLSRPQISGNRGRNSAQRKGRKPHSFLNGNTSVHLCSTSAEFTSFFGRGGAEVGWTVPSSPAGNNILMLSEYVVQNSSISDFVASGRTGATGSC